MVVLRIIGGRSQSYVGIVAHYRWVRAKSESLVNHFCKQYNNVKKKTINYIMLDG